MKSSRGYTGRGKAIYANNETYDGDFVDGVRFIRETLLDSTRKREIFIYFWIYLRRRI